MNDDLIVQPRKSIILTKLRENYENNQKRKSLTNPNLISIEKIKISPKNTEINKATNSPKTTNTIVNEKNNASQNNIIKSNTKSKTKSDSKVIKNNKKRCFLFRCFGDKL